MRYADGFEAYALYNTALRYTAQNDGTNGERVKPSERNEKFNETRCISIELLCLLVCVLFRFVLLLDGGGRC